MILTKESIESVNVDDLVNEKIDSGQIDELLILVPTNRKLRHLKKEIISALPGKTAAAINIETIGTISEKLLECSRRYVQLSEAASTILIKQSAAEVKLNYFSTYKDEIPYGTLDRVKNVISEYKKHGITPSLLKKEAERLERNEKLKALDIANIYSVFLEKCGKLNALETGDIYNGLTGIPASEFTENFKKLFPSLDLIVINGFNEFTSPEVEIINSMSCVKGTRLFLNFDYYLYNPMIFSHLTKCYEKLERKGFKRIEDFSHYAHSKFQNAVRGNLFLNRSGKTENGFSDNIIKISAGSREEEIEIIAKEIKHLICEQGVEANKICIAFNLIQDYSKMIRDKFNSYGIPCNLTDRISLDNSASVAAIINLLEIIESDYYYKNIFRVVSSGFVKIGDVDLSNLMKVAASLKIVAGFDNWKNIINDAINNLKYSDDTVEQAEYKTRVYQKALADIKYIGSLLEPLNRKLTISEFLKQLENVVHNTNLFHILLDDNCSSAEENIKAVSTFFETATEVFNLLAQDYGNDEKFKLKFYIDQLRTACGWARFNIKEKSDYGVLVTTIEEIRGLLFSHLFIGGLCDCDFPTRYSPEIFFSGSFVKQENIHQTEERYKFYQSLCAWDKKLYLTHPVSQGGKELVESIFLKDFCKYFVMSSRNSDDYESVIYSYEDLLQYAGSSQINNLDDDIINGLMKIGIETKDIQRAVDVDNLRLSDPYAESIYNGYLNAEGDDDENSQIKTDLAKRIPNQFSITQLENYAKCPFKYFVERILNLEILEEPVEEIEAMEMGNLLHSILYKFYTELKRKGNTFPENGFEKIDEAEKLIFEIADKEIEDASFSSPLSFYEKEKLLGFKGDKKSSVLYKLLENEITEYNGYLPEYFEVGFGRIRKKDIDERLSINESLNIGEVKLRGKIDRVEVNIDENRINIVDYKLGGAKPGISELWEGISLQLPLYLFVAQKLIEKQTGVKYGLNQMYIYSLKYAAGKFGKDRVAVSKKRKPDPEELENLLEKTLNNIAGYVKLISKGKFNLSRLDNKENTVCKYCDFRPVCRIVETG